MLLKVNGTEEWTNMHNYRFKKTKFAILCFSRTRVPDSHRPGKTIPVLQPNFIYEGTAIPPQDSHKFLGVHFDQEL